MKIRRKSGASGTGGAVSYEGLQNQVGFYEILKLRWGRFFEQNTDFWEFL
jgi:hypothetical protein